MADRLDRLDRILRAESTEWIRFQVREGSTEVVVVVDRVLSEARQQAIAMKLLLAEIRMSRQARANPAPAATGTPTAGTQSAAGGGDGGGATILDLVNAINSKRSAATGQLPA